MLTLYYKESCPFCQRVLEMADNLGVTFDLKDIESSDDLAAELIEIGGKRQVPFLVDIEKNVQMYESSDIIDYIRENKPAAAEGAVKPRIHMAADATCVACEG